MSDLVATTPKCEPVMCKSDLYGGRHMTITTAMAKITEITAIATVAACATRKTRNEKLLSVPATRAPNCHVQGYVTESVAGRSVGHSMWI